MIKLRNFAVKALVLSAPAVFVVLETAGWGHP
jgi:hypothetical protein